MNSILYKLKQESIWQEYLRYKLEKGHLTKKDQAEFIEYIETKKYEKVVETILNEKGLSIPTKKLINKMGNGKKRVVYSFQDDENKVFKLLSYLLYRYDEKQSPGCFSFRKGYGAHRAIAQLVKTPNISAMWCYKLDIQDYFNSISIPILLPILRNVINDDDLLYRFLEKMLTENKACHEGIIIEEQRGVMAGTPISPFLANIYLKEIDTYFINAHIPYARYSDDIILFAKTKEAFMQYKQTMLAFLETYQLNINSQKEKIVEPMGEWEFLGISYQNGEIDLSGATKDKLKGKIRRKARAIHRWKNRKRASDEHAMRVMIQVFNKKFFENCHANEFTWSRWFFPLVTVTNGLEEMDHYLQQYIRYIPYGRHRKQNYKVKYSDLKELGYKSLVNEYYKFKTHMNDNVAQNKHDVI